MNLATSPQRIIRKKNYRFLLRGQKCLEKHYPGVYGKRSKLMGAYASTGGKCAGALSASATGKPSVPLSHATSGGCETAACAGSQGAAGIRHAAP